MFYLTTLATYAATGGSAFPGITDLMYGVDELDPAQAQAVYEAVKKHLSGNSQLIQVKLVNSSKLLLFQLTALIFKLDVLFKVAFPKELF